MKKSIIIGIVIVLLVVLFLPFAYGKYDDGGTKTYTSLTYRVVKWNKYVVNYNELDKNGEPMIETYSKTSVFLFPNNFKSIDELWEIEKQNN